MGHDLDHIEREALDAFDAANDARVVEELRIKYLGAKGLLKDLMGGIKDVPPEERKAFGQRANALKSVVSQAFESARERCGAEAPSGPLLDVTRPGVASPLGHEHPITATIREIREILQRLGFRPVEGPEIEDEFHNFDALNIPPGHPARDDTNNFYLQVRGQRGAPKPMPFLLRSQTSTVQIRALERFGAPLRISACGRCFRPDAVDATHHYCFHQVEALAVDKGITLGDLKGILDLFVREYLGPDTKTRLRPHYFPFTEVSAEIDVSSPLFKKEWLELGGCGMVDPNVLRAVKIDPEVYTGFAWGLGIERMFMLRHGVDDIRHFLENDVRFLHQF